MKIGILLVAFISSVRTSAQVPVDRESHHKVILQNDYIRMLDGHIPQRDTTPLHLHAANSVVVFLSLSTFAIQTPGNPPVVTSVHPGDMKYAAYGDKPVNHIVWNQGPSMFHFYVVELAKPHPGAPCPTLSQPGLQLQWKQPSVGAWYLEPPTGGSTRLPACPCARLLIDLSGTITAIATAATYTRRPGGFVYFPPGTLVDIRGDHTRAILLEMQ